MSILSPLSEEEVVFAKRLLFETLHFAEAIEKSAEPRFRSLGLQNGAIENFLRAMDLSSLKCRLNLYDGPEPETVAACPWESQTAFLLRNAELFEWISNHEGEPADIRCFVFAEVSE